MRDYVQFIVLRRKNRWTLKSADQERIFPSESEAVEAAITLANDCGKNGKPSMVLLRRGKSRFDAIWTYGRDSYPPKLSAFATDRDVSGAGAHGEESVPDGGIPAS